MIKFSIIIPVYRVELFLEKCIDSIVSQDYENYEIILVDDGSPDNCPLICDSYKNKYNYISVIHKDNGGLSSARNAGILQAKGEYLLFVDSDDYWESNNALSLIEKELLKSPDILIFGHKKYDFLKNIIFYDKRVCDKELLTNRSREDVVQLLIANHTFPAAAWVTVTKRQFILDNQIFFIEGIKAEDIDWLIHCFYKAQSFNVLNEYFYIYLINRSGSITNTADLKSIKDLLFTIEKWNKILDEKKELDKYFLSYLAYEYSIIIYLINNITKDQFNEVETKLLELKYILKYAIGFKTKGIYYLSKILPFFILARLIKVAYRNFNVLKFVRTTFV